MLVRVNVFACIITAYHLTDVDRHFGKRVIRHKFLHTVHSVHF